VGLVTTALETGARYNGLGREETWQLRNAREMKSPRGNFIHPGLQFLWRML